MVPLLRISSQDKASSIWETTIMTDFNQWAEFWRSDVGVNVIPANSKSKIPKVEWKKYQDSPIPQETHDAWKSDDMFDHGMALICGKVFHKYKSDDLYLNMIDLDNALGIGEFCAGKIDIFSNDTIVEQHANTNKAHIYFYSRGAPIPQKGFDSVKKDEIDSNTVPGIEIKSGGKLLSYCAPGPHKDGSEIGIVKSSTVSTINGLAISNKVRKICEKYDLHYDDTTKGTGTTGITAKNALPVLLDKNHKIVAGHNRSLGQLLMIDSFYGKLKSMNMPPEFYYMIAEWLNHNYMTEPQPIDKIRKNVDQSLAYVDDDRKAEQDKTYVSLMEGHTMHDSKTADVVFLIEFYVKRKKIVDRTEIIKKVSSWQNKFLTGEKSDEIIDIPKSVAMCWDDYELFDNVKRICREYGDSDHYITLSKDQTTECAEWMIAKYHIKKLELDGKMIYFDEICYSFKTEQFISYVSNGIIPHARMTAAKEIRDYIMRNCTPISSGIIQEHSHKKCLINGTYDIHTGLFIEEHSPNNIIINSIPHKFDESAPPGDAHDIIKRIINNDSNLSVFEDFISICLYPDIGIYVMIMFLGIAGTGKTQLSKFLQNLYGTDNVSNFTIHSISSDSTSQIECANSLINIDEDMSDADIKNVAVLKKWVTRDWFSARGIYSNPVKFRPLSRLMANANALFEITGDEHQKAMYDRVHIIELSRRFRKTDGEIADIITNSLKPENYDHYITKALKNATTLYHTKKIKYLQTPEQVENIWNKFGNRIQEFVKYRTIPMQAGIITKTEIWNAWDDFMTLRSYPHERKNKFFLKLEEIIEQHAERMGRENNREYGYTGIRLMTDGEIADKEQMQINMEEK